MRGYLTKRPGGYKASETSLRRASQRVGSAWAGLTDAQQRRFFVIRPGGILESFRDEAHATGSPRRTLDCRGCRVALGSDLQTFTVFTVDRDLTLRAATPEAARSWADAIATAGGGVNEVQPAQAIRRAEMAREEAAAALSQMTREAEEARRQLLEAGRRAERLSTRLRPWRWWQLLHAFGVMAASALALYLGMVPAEVVLITAVPLVSLLCLRQGLSRERHRATTGACDVRLSATQPASTSEATDQEYVCVVCMDASKTHLLVPCGHQCVCGECARALTQCPLCRRRCVGRAIKVYK